MDMNLKRHYACTGGLARTSDARLIILVISVINKLENHHEK